MRAGSVPTSFRTRFARFLVFLLPIMLLSLATVRAGLWGNSRSILFVAIGFQVVASLIGYRMLRLGRQPLGSSILVLYLLALGWMWVGFGNMVRDDWFFQFAQGALVIVLLLVFAARIVRESEPRAVHQAYRLAQQLAERKDWPADLESCRFLPEIKALREAINADATPAFALLRNARPQVRLAALTALESRGDWRTGQAELVFDVAYRATEPLIRAAALRTLAHVEERNLLEKIAEYLRDSSPEARRATADALLWDTEHRWPWIRSAVRRALADPALQEDGSLIQGGQILALEAVKDLNAWLTEKGMVSIRAAQTLAAHYGRSLSEGGSDKLAKELRQQLLDARAPAVLRIELAQLLHSKQLLDKPTQERLLDPMNPAPVRLIVAEALLSNGRHAGAVTALRDVARVPNREIALATADVVQRRLGIDMGLAPGEALPKGSSRQAAEITRRVMQWAQQTPANDLLTGSTMLLH